MAGWRECTIADLGTVIGGATPSTKDPENYEEGNIPWITPKDLSTFSDRYISRGERNITEKGLKGCSAQLMPRHSVLFTSRAPIGYIAIAENEVCTNQGFKSVVPNDRTDYLFLYYLLKYNKDRIESLGSGTTFKEVSDCKSVWEEPVTEIAFNNCFMVNHIKDARISPTNEDSEEKILDKELSS